MKYTVSILFLFIWYCAFTQTYLPYIAADSIIRKGIELHDEGRFATALAEYNRVHPNDEYYWWAMYEKSVTWSEMEQYDKAFAVLDTMRNLKLHRDVYFYNLLGNTLDALGRRNEALKAYSEAYPRYTHTYLLSYNYALTLYRAGKFDEAEALLEKSIRINP